MFEDKRLLQGVAVFGWMILLSACATPTTIQEEDAATTAIVAASHSSHDSGGFIERSSLFQRYESHAGTPIKTGRYTTIGATANPASRDLLQQTVEIDIPVKFTPTVKEGLQHLLQKTGITLCDTSTVKSLFGLSLPAAHYRLGPMPLHAALSTMAGNAYTLMVEPVSRTVCFELATPLPSSSSSSSYSEGGKP